MLLQMKDTALMRKLTDFERCSLVIMAGGRHQTYPYIAKNSSQSVITDRRLYYIYGKNYQWFSKIWLPIMYTVVLKLWANMIKASILMR